MIRHRISKGTRTSLVRWPWSDVPIIFEPMIVAVAVLEKILEKILRKGSSRSVGGQCQQGQCVDGEENFQLGQPTLSGASVTAKVVGETKGEKIYVQKFRRRKNSKRRTGHRQKYIKVQISKIAG